MIRLASAATTLSVRPLRRVIGCAFSSFQNSKILHTAHPQDIDGNDIVFGKMKGALLPGNSTAVLDVFDIPSPKFGEVLIRTRASTICGSDIRCIFHEYQGAGQEAYQKGIICGHEPAGMS